MAAWSLWNEGVRSPPTAGSTMGGGGGKTGVYPYIIGWYYAQFAGPVCEAKGGVPGVLAAIRISNVAIYACYHSS